MAARLGIRAEKGYTLIEVIIVMLVIGILASLAVPQYYKDIEKDKASEAVNLLLELKGAQDRYYAKYGVYCYNTPSNCAGFDITVPALKYFNAVPAFAGGTGNPSWSLTLTRNGSPASYGQYSLVYDAPNAVPALSCNQTTCMNDLLPNPN